MLFTYLFTPGTLCFVEDEDVLHDPDAFFSALAEIEPTVFFGPPAIYERVYHRLRELRRNMSGLQRIFLDWSNSTVRNKHLPGEEEHAHEQLLFDRIHRPENAHFTKVFD
jgi:long-subunit acyl-CoA synthetase (AMP-forming)